MYQLNLMLRTYAEFLLLITNHSIWKFEAFYRPKSLLKTFLQELKTLYQAYHNNDSLFHEEQNITRK